jgi:hypothetical protein
LPKLTPVTLTITQEGQPLSGATVTLIAADQPQTWYPTGITNEKGNVELFTNGKYKGAPKGKYKVTVTKIHTEPSQFGTPLEEGQPGYEEWSAKVSQETRAAYSVVEKKFTDANTTPLEIEIPSRTSSFDLGKTVKDKPLPEE